MRRLALLATLLAGCAHAPSGPPLRTVDRVDLQRYLGKWYEIATIPMSFQKGCVGVTAVYTLRPDGDVDVVNTCRKETLDGPERSAQGKAWSVDPSNAKLEVQFFWPFHGSYWVIDLDPDYRWAVVGHPSRDVPLDPVPDASDGRDHLRGHPLPAPGPGLRPVASGEDAAAARQGLTNPWPRRSAPSRRPARPRAPQGREAQADHASAPPSCARRALARGWPALPRPVEADGGAVLAAYREPLGGHALLFAALPVEKVERTSFQRDVSDGHVRRLTVAMDKTRRYLDPIIAVRDGGRYLTPNGGHRLTALKELGAKAVLALLVPEKEVAYQILALNIEKAHNLREKALEVVRMYRDLAGSRDPRETEMALEFEEPALVTLGFAYEERPRLSGGALRPHPAQGGRASSTEKLSAAMRGAGAARRRGAGLRRRGGRGGGAAQGEGASTRPTCKDFVVARVNPLRFMKGGAPPFDELFATMTRRAAGMDPGKIKSEDVARSGGARPSPSRSPSRRASAASCAGGAPRALPATTSRRSSSWPTTASVVGADGRLAGREELPLLPADVPLQQLGEGERAVRGARPARAARGLHERSRSSPVLLPEPLRRPPATGDSPSTSSSAWMWARNTDSSNRRASASEPVQVPRAPRRVSACPAIAFFSWKATSRAWWCSLERGRSSRLIACTAMVPNGLARRRGPPARRGADLTLRVETANHAPSAADSRINPGVLMSHHRKHKHHHSRSPSEGSPPPRVAVVAGLRTPFVRSGGDFKDLSAVDLGAIVVNELVARSGLPLVRVRRPHLRPGDPLPALLAHRARGGAAHASCPGRVPAHTTSRACATSLQAATEAADQILLGHADTVIAGGAESLSDAPIFASHKLAQALVNASRARSIPEKAEGLRRPLARRTWPRCPRR